jgi:hypothetical protein
MIRIMNSTWLNNLYIYIYIYTNTHTHTHIKKTKTKQNRAKKKKQEARVYGSARLGHCKEKHGCLGLVLLFYFL